MNDMTERIHEAATAAAETIQPSDLPTEPSAPRVRRHLMAYLTPLAAAGTVLVIVAAVFAVRLTDHQTQPARPVHTVHSEHSAGPSHVPAGVPAFYLDADRAARIAVRSVATGKVLSTAGQGYLHGHASWFAASAAPDNRHFFITTDGCRPTIYRLVIDGSGQVTSFGATKIRLPKGTSVYGMDATDGGSRVAIALRSCHRNTKNDVVLANPVTGAMRTWSLGRLADRVLDDVSISGDGRTVLLTVEIADAGNEYYIMSTATGYRKRVRFPTGYAGIHGMAGEASITANGTSVIVLVGSKYGVARGLVKCALSGRPERVVYRWPKSNGKVNVGGLTLVSGYGNRWLVYESVDYTTTLGWVQGHTFHRLPNDGHGDADGVFAW